MKESRNLDGAFAALADPTRRAILARLAKGEATVRELAAPFVMSQPAISQHLKVLEEAGLVASRVDGARRPRRLAKAGVEAMEQWLAMLRTALEKNYERLDQVLADMNKDDERKSQKSSVENRKPAQGAAEASPLKMQRKESATTQPAKGSQQERNGGGKQ